MTQTIPRLLPPARKRLRAAVEPPPAPEDSWRATLDTSELAGLLTALAVSGQRVADEPKTIPGLIFDLWRQLRLVDSGLALDTFRAVQEQGAPAVVLIDLADLLATIPEGTR